MKLNIICRIVIAILLIIFVCPMLLAQTDKKGETNYRLPDRGICAHRGAQKTFPENTVPAFLEAIRLGAHQVEFDVCMTKDGQLVVMHDLTVDRTTNGKGKVSDLTFDEIRRLDAGIKKGERFRGTKVPTFDEALDCMTPNIWINIHLKNEVDAAEIALKIKKKQRLYQAFLACSIQQAEAARKACPNILICNMSRQPNNDVYIQKTIENKSDFIQIVKDAYKKEDVTYLKQKGIKVNCFGIPNVDPVLLKKMFDQGIDFPLVDAVDEMLDAAEKNGIKRWK